MTGVVSEQFDATFWNYFPFLDPPDMNHKTLASPSGAIVHICSSQLLGVQFLATGLTQCETQGLLRQQMSDFLSTSYDTAVLSECTMLSKKNNSYSPPSNPFLSDTVEKRFKQQIENKSTKAEVKQLQAHSFVSLLFEHAAKLKETQPEFNFFLEKNLFGCKASFLNTEYLVEARYRKKIDAKEAVCKYILASVLK
jgi:hypothetical protein